MAIFSKPVKEGFVLCRQISNRLLFNGSRVAEIHNNAWSHRKFSILRNLIEFKDHYGGIRGPAKVVITPQKVLKFSLLLFHFIIKYPERNSKEFNVCRRSDRPILWTSHTINFSTDRRGEGFSEWTVVRGESASLLTDEGKESPNEIAVRGEKIFMDIWPTTQNVVETLTAREEFRVHKWRVIMNVYCDVYS